MTRLSLVPLIVLSLGRHVVSAIGSMPVANTASDLLEPVPALQDSVPADMATMVDAFQAINPNASAVQTMVGKFMNAYKIETARTALEPTLLTVVKAEKSSTRVQIQEKASESGAKTVVQVPVEEFHLLLLLRYHFTSSMLSSLRPYVSVLQLAMNCFNATTADAKTHLTCDIEHYNDMPRHNESMKELPTYVPRMIANAAPSSTPIRNVKKDIVFDAFEAQDLVYDNGARGIVQPDGDKMRYVRFRVQGGGSHDCMIAIEHTKRTNVVRYQDTACFDSAKALAASTSFYRFTKENISMFILVASIAGAAVAICVIWRGRRRQRTGYSYVHSGVAQKAKTNTKDSNNDATTAVAC